MVPDPNTSGQQINYGSGKDVSDETIAASVCTPLTGCAATSPAEAGEESRTRPFLPPLPCPP
jgi:hypothetical protein